MFQLCKNGLWRIGKANNFASTQTSAVDLGTVPAELISSFSLVFYQSAEDAVFKALGVE